MWFVANIDERIFNLNKKYCNYHLNFASKFRFGHNYRKLPSLSLMIVINCTSVALQKYFVFRMKKMYWSFFIFNTIHSEKILLIIIFYYLMIHQDLFRYYNGIAIVNTFYPVHLLYSLNSVYFCSIPTIFNTGIGWT